MVLGRPQHVVAEAIHELCHVARGGEGLPQAFRGIAPVVGGRAGAADIVELDLADIEHMEVFDHRAISPASKVARIDLVWLWFRNPHSRLAAKMMRTSEPPH